LNYLVGVFAAGGAGGGVADDSDLFKIAREMGLECAPYGRKIMDVQSLPDIMKEASFSDITEGTISIKMAREDVKEFYSIPAQSAGLYPKTPYEMRLELLDLLLDNFEDQGIDDYYQKWGWIVGSKLPIPSLHT